MLAFLPLKRFQSRFTWKLSLRDPNKRFRNTWGSFSDFQLSSVLNLPLYQMHECRACCCFRIFYHVNKALECVNVLTVLLSLWRITEASFTSYWTQKQIVGAYAHVVAPWLHNPQEILEPNLAQSELSSPSPLFCSWNIISYTEFLGDEG